MGTQLNNPLPFYYPIYGFLLTTDGSALPRTGNSRSFLPIAADAVERLCSAGCRYGRETTIAAGSRCGGETVIAAGYRCGKELELSLQQAIDAVKN